MSVSASRAALGQEILHIVTEYTKLEGDHQDHKVQPLVLCRVPQEPHHVAESIV